MNIGIIGYGKVGQSVGFIFEKNCKIYIVDPVYNESCTIKTLVKFCPYIFISVPTPFRNGKFDGDIVRSVICDISKMASKIKSLNIITIIIKSTILPRFARKIQNENPNLRIVISPEFLTERTAIRDILHQEFIVLGSDFLTYSQLVFKLHKDFSICNPKIAALYMTLEESAFLKLMRNALLATKVIFANEFKKYYDKIKLEKGENEDGINEILEVMTKDPMCGSHPIMIPGPDGDYGFGGKCLPKDCLAILEDAKSVGIDLSLLRKVWELNLGIRADRDWERISGAVITKAK